MGKKTPAAPTPPDPVATARAQGEMNADTARLTAQLNRVNQVTPFGNLTWSRQQQGGTPWNEDSYLAANQDVADAVRGGQFASGQAHYAKFGRNEGRGGVAEGYIPADQDVWTATQTLSPAEQEQLDLANQAQSLYGRAALAQLGRVQGVLSEPLDVSGLPTLRSAPDFTGIGDPNQARDAVEAALMERLNPQLERDRAALETRLANQGITMGSEAWTRGMGDFGRQANDARLGAILNAGQEQSRMFGLGLQQAAFGNQARTQGLSELTALRQMPLNEAAALMSGSQVQSPQFVTTPSVNVAPTDYMGAVNQNYQGQFANWQERAADVRSQNQMAAQLGGQILGSVASFGLGAGGFGNFGGMGGALGNSMYKRGWF